MADEHIPPDWRELARARAEFDERQRKLRKRERAQARVPRMTDEEYRREYFGAE